MIALFPFETALGPCAAAFTSKGLFALALPSQTTRATLRAAVALVAGRGLGSAIEQAEAPTGDAARAIDLVRRHLAGEDVDLTTIEVDPHGWSAFRVRVYDEARRVPRGEVKTYADLARAAGSAGAARAVGRAMATNPCPIVIPCHRVLASSGALHGFSAPGGIRTKSALLELEGRHALAPSEASRADTPRGARSKRGRTAQRLLPFS